MPSFDNDLIFKRAFQSVREWSDFETNALVVMRKLLNVNAQTIEMWAVKARKNGRKYLTEILKSFKKHSVIFSNTLNTELMYLMNNAKFSVANTLNIPISEKLIKAENKLPVHAISAQKEIGKSVNLLSSNILQQMQLSYASTIDEIAFNYGKLKSKRKFVSDLRKETLKSMNRLGNRGLPNIYDKIGRKWNLTNYMEMATRANFKNAYLDEQKARFQQYGVDLVISNVLGDCSLICEPYQGQVFSRSGNSKKYASVSEAEISGHTTHINCRHFWFPYLENVSTVPELPSAKEIKKNRKNRIIQRYNERQIRKWKRRVAIEPSPYNKNKLAYWDKRQGAFIKKNKGMGRQLIREEIVIPKTPFPATPNVPVVPVKRAPQVKTVPPAPSTRQQINSQLKKWSEKNIADTRAIWWENSVGTFDDLGTKFNTAGLKLEHRSPASTYWSGTDKGGKFVIRQSDHWGKGIRSVDWYLKGYKKGLSWNWTGGERFGKIYVADLSFKNMEAIERYHRKLFDIVKNNNDKVLNKYVIKYNRLKDAFRLNQQLDDLVKYHWADYNNPDHWYYKRLLKNEDLRELVINPFTTKKQVRDFAEFLEVMGVLKTIKAPPIKPVITKVKTIKKAIKQVAKKKAIKYTDYKINKIAKFEADQHTTFPKYQGITGSIENKGVTKALQLREIDGVRITPSQMIETQLVADAKGSGLDLWNNIAQTIDSGPNWQTKVKEIIKNRLGGGSSEFAMKQFSQFDDLFKKYKTNKPIKTYRLVSDYFKKGELKAGGQLQFKRFSSTTIDIFNPKNEIRKQWGQLKNIDTLMEINLPKNTGAIYRNNFLTSLDPDKLVARTTSFNPDQYELLLQRGLKGVIKKIKTIKLNGKTFKHLIINIL